ncbi:MAG: hypothetical protein K2N24_11595 [Lachnospiraceae bacterium]|nr:hypothetical protein [Lachnospiraceae bacterium]
MEKLVNCYIVVEIESINKISGGNQYYEIIFSSPDKTRYKITFDCVWDIRCSIENAYIERSSHFLHGEKEKSSILLIENSNYVKYFEKQVSGTRPIEELKNYILFDSVDTVIELLTIKEPVITQCHYSS